MSNHGVYYTKSPLLASRTPVWRSRFVIVCLAFGFTALTARAAWVQLYKYEFYQNQADQRYVRTLVLPASRGEILDRNGITLASSIVAPSLWASPAEVQITDVQLKELARLLEISEDELKAKLDAGPDRKRQFVWLRRLAGYELAQQVLDLNVKGIYVRDDYRRNYPEKEATAHVLGGTNIEDIGQEGVELAFNNTLVGKPGFERYIQDRIGQPVLATDEGVSAVNGDNVQLSIDRRIQHYAYEKLQEAVIANKAQSGSIVVIDAQTGEILALVNYPSYDPNVRVNATGLNRRNRAVTDLFEPGSTVKPFVVARALDMGLVKPTTVIPTARGSLNVGGKVITDVGRGYSQLTVQEIIQKSSNIGIARIAMKMEPQELWETYTKVGFGIKPQIDFPGIRTGVLRPYKNWRPIEFITQSYGYGLSVSLLQLTYAYTVFARDGDMIPLTLMRNERPSAQGMRVFTPETAAQVREMLRLVTVAGGGTRAQVEGYSVGGKSGTARKLNSAGRYAEKYLSWFVGVAPVNHPRIVVGVMIDEPTGREYYGGAVAAPVFSQVVGNSLHLMGVAPEVSLPQAARTGSTTGGGRQ